MKSWFRCTHKKTSLPVTRRRKEKKEVEINRQANTFVVCLNCGEQIPYSFSESRVVAERRKASEEGGATPQFHSPA